MADNVSVNGGISFGTIIAAILSWLKWHSIGYAILHGILGWLYVIYFWLEYGFSGLVK
jgi:hypothetical protein